MIKELISIMLATLIIKPPIADTKIQIIKKYFLGSLAMLIKKLLTSLVRDMRTVNDERTIKIFRFIPTLVKKWYKHVENKSKEKEVVIIGLALRMFTLLSIIIIDA